MLNDRTLSAIRRAAALVANAEALLITAGAGMGVDSGLPDFRSNNGFWRTYPPLEKLGIEFEQIAQPHWFESKPEMAWAWYGHRQKIYESTPPHAGYEILRKWTLAMPAGSFVVTSNVDEHFYTAGFSEAHILEQHGSINRYQCSVPCSDAVWLDDSPDLQIDLNSLLARGKLPHCPECGAIARPNILMFNDVTWIDNVRRKQQERYALWLSAVRGKRTVIIECGAGKVIPTIRNSGEAISQRALASLIRINPDAVGDNDPSVSLPLPALQALTLIHDDLSTAFHSRAISTPDQLQEQQEHRNEWREILEQKCKTNPGGVISTQPMNHLKNIKFSKVYSKAWQVQLPSGWTVWVDCLDVRRTYLGMITGIPPKELMDDEIEESREFVRKNFFGPEAILIEPKVYDAASDAPILPPLRFAAQVCSFEGISDGDEGSWVNLIWFAEIDDDKSIKAYVKEALQQIDWKSSASGYSI